MGEDGCSSTVAADYVRSVGEVAEEEVREAPPTSKPAASARDFDALLAAAEAAGACDEADNYVAGNLPPCQLFWSKTLKEKATVEETEEDTQKRLRPLGLMSSTDAKNMAMQSKKPKRR